MVSKTTRVKQKLSKAVTPSSRGKACVVTTEATPENIESDARFAQTYNDNDNHGSNNEALHDDDNNDDNSTTPSTSARTSTSSPSTPPKRHLTPPDGSPASKYKLRVTAGPAYSTTTHHTLTVNNPHPHPITSTHLHTALHVRIKDYTGLPLRSPSSTPYFAHPLHAKDRYSISFSFVPRHDIPAADCVWGPDFDHPVRDRLPPGFNTAFGIVKRWIDPGVECDAYADEPWLYGPALSCWFGFRVGELVGVEGEGEGEGEGKAVKIPEMGEEGGVLVEGADGSGREVRQKLGMPDDADKRRKFFLDGANREKMVFEKGRVYHADFYNPYLDFNTFSLKLPGFSLGVLKYIDDKTHALRWVFKNKTTGDVYFVVVFNLLFGKELEDALKEEEEGQEGREEKEQKE